MSNVRLGLRERLHRRADDVIIDLRDGVAPTPVALVPPSTAAKDLQLREVRFFGTPAFRRLWFSQLASSLGDWIGIIALTAIAGLTGGEGLGGLSGVSLVLAARLIPGFFLSPFAGVLIDRWDRRRVMVVTDFIRAAVLCLFALYFSTGPSRFNLFVALVIASLLLELVTLLWSPAKDASVPNIVPKSYLPTANSLSLAAAYGPLLIAGALYALLVQIPNWVGADGIPDESIALYFDAFTYLVSAAVIWSLHIPREKVVERPKDESRTHAGFREALEGLSYVVANTRVRTVTFGLAIALIGGAMVVPLGQQFATVVLDAGPSGYGFLLTGMGIGTAVGVLLVSALQKRLRMDVLFVIGVFSAALFLFLTASMDSVIAASFCVAGLGLSAGAVYVLAYSSIQLNTADEMRGRVFATLYTVTRVCILLALVVAPLLAGLLDNFTETNFSLSGVRATLWLGAVITCIAGILSVISLRRGLVPARD